MNKLLIISMLTALQLGCLSVMHKPVLDIPFISQPEKYECGSSCLMMALQYFGKPAEYDPIRQQTHIPAISGTTAEVIAHSAETFGLHATLSQLTPPQIKNTFDSNHLIILLIPPAPDEKIGHFVLLTGTKPDNNIVYAHSGTKRNQIIYLNDQHYSAIILTDPENPNSE